MPPKKQPPAASKKTEQKKKEKIVEDKTFGLKNKKGAKTQKYIQQVAKCYNANQGKDQPKTSKKEEKKKELEEFNKIFKPVVTQKVEKGVDPKSVICVFFKQGQCSKGDKCKFSHNLAVEKKGEKRNIYEDTREEDKMEDWDEDKLKDVVEKKHGEKERTKPKTEIICKFFLEALEASKYGWFWECPNGADKCHYRHALPPGFVLKRDLKKADKKDEISIEDLVEKERAKLDYNLPKITLKTFMEWKKRKINDKREKSRKETERKKAEYKAGRNIGLSGREMFTFNPDLVNDGALDDDEATFDNLRREDEDDNESSNQQIKEIDFNALQNDLRDVDGSGTQILGKRQFDTRDDDDTGDAAPSAEATATTSSVSEVKIDDIPIDENLFDDDEDLDDLDEELADLKVDAS